MIKRSSFLFMLILFVGAASLSTFLVRISSAASTVFNKIPVPTVGAQYTIQRLLDIINTNNPNKNSNFLVPIDNKSVVMNASCWAVDADNKIKNIDGSASVGSVGIQNIINSNKSLSVILKTDLVLVKHLQLDGRLNSETAAKYSRILLWFELQGYRFYLNDPYPGKIIRTPTGIRNPALNIIKKWAV